MSIKTSLFTSLLAPTKKFVKKDLSLKRNYVDTLQAVYSMRCPLILFLLRFLLICLAKICHLNAYILHVMGFKNLHNVCHLSVLRYKSSFIWAVLYELLHIIVSNSRISSLNSLTTLATRNSPCPAVCHGTTDSSSAFWELNQTTKRCQSRHRKEKKNWASASGELLQWNWGSGYFKINCTDPVKR